MLKLEIKLDDNKIAVDKRYKIESIYETLERAFIQNGLCVRKESDGTLFICGNGNPEDYGAFGSIITSLKEKNWFMNYVIKWVWYNSDDGENEEDFAVEDVLYHYTRRASAA